MAYPNALSAYRETRVRTAGPGQLIIMLYDEAIKQMDQSIELLSQKQRGKIDPSKIEVINKALVKAQEVITELMVSLDFEKGGDIAQNLFSLYTWFNRELLEANLSKDVDRVANVRNQMNELRSAWIEVVAKTATEHLGNNSAGVNIAG